MTTQRLLAAALLLALAPLARGDGLRVVTDFEGGSAKVMSLDQEAARVAVMPAGPTSRGWACWWYFKLEGIKPGTTLTVEVVGGGFTTPDRAMFSLDDRTWTHTEPGERLKDRTVYKRKIDASEAWFAWGPPFVTDDAWNLVTATAWASPHARAFELCKSKEGRSVAAMRISEAGVKDEERLGVWIEARQHAWESGSSWVCRGLVDWLISDDPRAVEMRRKCLITVVPVMDVDNVARGYGGKNQTPHDHNRDWSAEPVWPEVRAAMAAIRKLDEAGRFDLFIDLHNPAPGDKQPFFFVAPPDLLREPGRSNLTRFLDAGRLEMQGPLKLAAKPKESGPAYDKNWEKISKNWVTKNCKPHVVAVTLETAYNTPASTQEGYRRVGQELGLAAERYLRDSPRKP